MSDEIDPVTIGAWWAAVMFQAGTAIRDGIVDWSMRQWQRYPPNFERIVNGETRSGWRRIIPCPQEIASHVPSSSIFEMYLVVSAPTNHADEPDKSMRPLRSSVMLDITKPLLDGRSMFTLRKCSILRPVNIDLAHICYDQREWAIAFSSYINFRTVAVGFQRRRTTDISVYLIDVYQRKVRQVMITAPEEGLAMFVYATKQPKARLHIVFEKFEDGNRVQFFDAKYDIWPDGDSNDLFFRALSWQSIVIPHGDRTEEMTIWSGCGRVFVFCHAWNAAGAENALFISIDHAGTWHVDTLAQWQSRMRETRFGASIWEAIEAFSKLPPPNRWVWPSSPPLRCHLNSIPFPIEGEVLFNGRKSGIMQRWLIPPSLKRIAVEAFCKAYPHVSLAAIKEATGVDVSDGVTEDGGNHAKVINL